MITFLRSLAELFNPSPAKSQHRYERYLSQSVDMCDLENRIRMLDNDRRSLYDKTR